MDDESQRHEAVRSTVSRLRHSVILTKTRRFREYGDAIIIGASSLNHIEQVDTPSEIARFHLTVVQFVEPH